MNYPDMDDELPEEKRREIDVVTAMVKLRKYEEQGFNGSDVTFDTVLWALDVLQEAKDDHYFDDKGPDALAVVDDRIDGVMRRREMESRTNVVRYPLYRSPMAYLKVGGM